MESNTAGFALGVATWRTGRHICIVFDSGPFALLRENMTSYTKPEVHDVLYCYQSRMEPRQQVTRGENLAKFVRVAFEIRERTDGHTDTLSQYFSPLPEAK